MIPSSKHSGPPKNLIRAGHSDAADFAGIEAALPVRLPGCGTCEEEAYRFLNLLFGTKPASAYIQIWRLSTKETFWFKSISDAAKKIAELSGEDIYVAVALAATDLGPHRRCGAEDALGIAAMWIDLDILGQGHQKTKLPPTAAEALGLIPSDLPPSLVVHSGHGFQAWWILREIFLFDTEADREVAAVLARRFGRLFKQRAALKDWDVDSITDLARLLRVPGTTNTKIASEPCQVKVVQENDHRYNLSELTEYLDETVAFAPAPLRSTRLTAENPGFVLDPMANPPIDKFNLLKEIEPRFLLSWEHKRSFQDSSASAYDQSLANFAAMVLWPDQQIVDLLIAHRRKHGADLKLRADYYKRTLDLAHQAAAKYWADRDATEVLNAGGPEAPAGDAHTHRASEINSSTASSLPTSDKGGGCADEVHAVADPEPPSPVVVGISLPSDAPQKARVITLCATPVSSDRRQRLLDAISTKLGVTIIAVKKFSGDPGQYRVETTRGSVQLGGVDGLISQAKLRVSLADATGRYIPVFDKEEWTSIAQGLLDACEVVDRGEDATMHGTLTEHLLAYLSERPPHESLADANAGREPFANQGSIYIFIDSFQCWLQIRRGERIGRNRLTADLRAYGAVPEKLPLVVDEKETSRSVWRLPIGSWDAGK